MTRLSALAAALGAFAIICPPTALAQRPPEDASTFAAYLSTGHQITPDITYLTASAHSVASCGATTHTTSSGSVFL